MSAAAVDVPAPVRLQVLAPPLTRADCAMGPRPCPWRSCHHHLGIERERRRASGTPREPPASSESCTLDIADRGGVTLEQIAETFSLTRERIRQIEAKALRHLAEQLVARGILEAGDVDRALLAIRAALRAPTL